jgi:hypothetical protein
VEEERRRKMMEAAHYIYILSKVKELLPTLVKERKTNGEPGHAERTQWNGLIHVEYQAGKCGGNGGG